MFSQNWRTFETLFFTFLCLVLPSGLRVHRHLTVHSVPLESMFDFIPTIFFFFTNWIISLVYLQLQASVQFHYHPLFAIKPISKHFFSTSHFILDSGISIWFSHFPLLSVYLSWWLGSFGIFIFRFIYFHFFLCMNVLPLAFTGTCTYVHRPTHIHITQNKNIFKLEINPKDFYFITEILSLKKRKIRTVSIIGEIRTFWDWFIFMLGFGISLL